MVLNPEVLRKTGLRQVEEGCLSLPGYRGIVTRSVWIRFQALDYEFKTVKFKAEDLLSQALEHEVDHLNGILYTDHLAEHEQLYKIEQPDQAEATTEDELDTPSTFRVH